MMRARVVVALLSCSGLVAGCGAAGATTSYRGLNAAQQRGPAAACPARLPSRSSRAAGRRFAPGRPTAERFCVYRGGGRRLRSQALYHDLALPHALNRSLRRLPRDHLCPAVAGLPSVVMLDYGSRVRHVVLETGGCPSIVAGGHRDRPLIDRAASTLLRFYGRTVG